MEKHLDKDILIENIADDYYRFCGRCLKICFFNKKHIEVNTFYEILIKESEFVIERRIPVNTNEDIGEEYLFSEEAEKYIEKTEKRIEYQYFSEILECQICKKNIFRQYELVDGYLKGKEHVYPDHQSWHILPNTQVESFLDNSPLYDVYLETLTAFNNALMISSSTLIRTIVEKICKDQNIPGNSLANKIDHLPLEPIYKDVLHKLRLLGNESVHEAKYGIKEELISAIRAVEFLIKKVYSAKWELLEMEKINKNLEDYKRKRR